MLTPEQIDGFRVSASRLTAPVVDFLLRDIARRIREAGGMTSSAAYEAWRAEWLGKGRREMETELARLLGVTRQQARALLRTAARYGYDTTLARHRGHMIPFDDNIPVQQLVSSAVSLAADELRNITQTTAIGMVDAHGKLLPLEDAYRACTDFAFQQVFTGAADYNTAIRQACRGIVQHGVTVTYATGVRTSIEAAVRRNMMGGLGLMVEQIEQQNHDELGCDGWEISAHANSAPDHEPIQGRQYPDQEYEALNNALVRRIGTLNCGHVASPIILGVDAPQYTPEELEKFRADNEKGVDFGGRHYTGYEATQRQRAIERAIRAQERRVLLAAPEDAEAASTKLQRLRQEYRRFSKGVGLRTEDERLHVSGFGPKRMKSLPKNVEVARKHATMKARPPVSEGAAVRTIGTIDIEKYKCVTTEIMTDEVVITDERIGHVKERHPNDYERFCSYIPRILAEPDYIIQANKPNTAVVLKEIEENGEKFKLILRIKVNSDPAEYKNSILSFWHIGETTWKKTIKNKNILYKKE